MLSVSFFQIHSRITSAHILVLVLIFEITRMETFYSSNHSSVSSLVINCFCLFSLNSTKRKFFFIFIYIHQPTDLQKLFEPIRCQCTLNSSLARSELLQRRDLLHQSMSRLFNLLLSTMMKRWTHNCSDVSLRSSSMTHLTNGTAN